MARGRSGADQVLLQQLGGRDVAAVAGADSEGAVVGREDPSRLPLKEEVGRHSANRLSST
jgi:hypothetical protein